MRSLSISAPTRQGAVVTALGLVVTLLVGFTNPAAATSTVTTTGQNRLGEVFGTVDGRRVSPRAGLIGVDTDGNGSTDAWAFCIDLATRLVPGVYTEGAWDAATVPDLGRIAWVLHHYPAAADMSTETAMAVQAAIWHFSDGFELSFGPGGNTEPLEDLYAYIVAKATTIPEPRPTLSVGPVGQETTAATGLVFEVRSTAPGPVKLSLRSAPVGATIRPVRRDGSCDLESAAVTKLGLVRGAGQFCLHSPVAGGPAVLTATVSEATALGRVFLKSGSQKLVFAGGGTVTASVEVTATWRQVPVTTTNPPPSTTTPSTSTTTPMTTTTSVAPVSSTTTQPPAATIPELIVSSAPTPAVQDRSASPPVQVGALPRTGVGIQRSLGFAVGLLTTGFGLVTIGRGRRPS